MPTKAFSHIVVNIKHTWLDFLVPNADCFFFSPATKVPDGVAS